MDRGARIFHEVASCTEQVEMNDEARTHFMMVLNFKFSSAFLMSNRKNGGHSCLIFESHEFNYLNVWRISFLFIIQANSDIFYGLTARNGARPPEWGYEVPRSPSETPFSIGLFWTCDRPISETPTYTTLTTVRYPCLRRDPNSKFQQASCRRLLP
jgi:hypothetical protein